MIASGMSAGVYNDTNMKEKRRHERVEVDLPVILRHSGKLIPATVLNISCGGMYIRAYDAKIDSSHPVEIIFDLSEEQRDVAMRGQITRLEEREVQNHIDIGVQFTSLFSLSHKAIEQYVNKNLN